jgi:hypothetical protein
MKTSDVESEFVDVLNNYNHPLFEIAYQMLDDSKFLKEQEINDDDKQYLLKLAD